MVWEDRFNRKRQVCGGGFCFTFKSAKDSPLEEEKTLVQPSRPEVFKDRLPEVPEFNRNWAVLPEMGFRDFVKAVNANQVELLKSRGVLSPRGSYSYSNFIVDLKSIPEEKAFHTQRWAMHLNQDQSKAVLNLYKGLSVQLKPICDASSYCPTPCGSFNFWEDHVGVIYELYQLLLAIFSHNRHYCVCTGGNGCSSKVYTPKDFTIWEISEDD